MKKIYMAYGSNLNTDQMKARCPKASLLGKGVLKDWKLTFRVHANIEPCEGAEVPVGLWLIESEDERSLDRYEGYPVYYGKKVLSVETDMGTIDAMAYVMNRMPDISMPSYHYLNIIAEGYDDFGIDPKPLETALKKTWLEVTFNGREKS